MPNPTSKLNLVINGVTTQLDIHDANAVDLTSNQTVAGDKEFTGTTTAHDVIPSATETYNLGSPTAQWKTFNGINPGALSLPSISSSGANAWIALDTTDWVKSAVTSAAQKYTPPADGWLNIRVNNATMLGLAITGGGNYMHQMVRSETPNGLALLIPVFKNTQVAILVAGNENLVYDRSTFYYCQGNV